jgi:hypothetical protein
MLAASGTDLAVLEGGKRTLHNAGSKASCWKQKRKGEIMEQKTDLSRRNFLKTSGGALVGGVVLGGIGGSLVAPRSAQAADPLGYLPTPISLGKTIDINLVRKLAWYHNAKTGG